MTMALQTTTALLLTLLSYTSSSVLGPAYVNTVPFSVPPFAYRQDIVTRALRTPYVPVVPPTAPVIPPLPPAFLPSAAIPPFSRAFPSPVLPSPAFLPPGLPPRVFPPGFSSPFFPSFYGGAPFPGHFPGPFTIPGFPGPAVFPPFFFRR